MYFTEVHVFRSETQKKELDLARVKNANYDLTEERLQLTSKLTGAEKKREREKKKFKNLKCSELAIPTLQYLWSNLQSWLGKHVTQ